MKKLVVVGGSDAGISAAFRAKEIDPTLAVTVVIGDRFPSYSVCGLPFFISGEVPGWQTLAHHPLERIEAAGIELLLDHRASAIDPQRQTVTVATPERTTLRLEYDRLVICTGAVSLRPNIEGLDLAGVHFLRTIGDGLALARFVETRRPGAVVVIGGGYIGMEMADAFTLRGMRVTLMEAADTLLTTFDPELSRLIESLLTQHGVRVATRMPVRSIQPAGDRLQVLAGDGVCFDADLVLVAAGIRPDTDLATSAGAQIGFRGAVRVNRKMETGLPNVFAAGDCVETWHRLLARPAYLPLGSTAHKQGRIAGENAAGGCVEFAGSIGTQVVKIFDGVVARTGLRHGEVMQAGFLPLTTQFEVQDRNRYYPGKQPLTIRVTGDRTTGRLLGAQMFGQYGSEVSKRIDVFAAAIHVGMLVKEISDLDLSYTPPLGSPWDPVQVAAQQWVNGLAGGA